MPLPRYQGGGTVSTGDVPNAEVKNYKATQGAQIAQTLQGIAKTSFDVYEKLKALKDSNDAQDAATKLDEAATEEIRRIEKLSPEEKAEAYGKFKGFYAEKEKEFGAGLNSRAGSLYKGKSAASKKSHDNAAYELVFKNEVDRKQETIERGVADAVSAGGADMEAAYNNPKYNAALQNILEARQTGASSPVKAAQQEIALNREVAVGAMQSFIQQNPQLHQDYAEGRKTPSAGWKTARGHIDAIKMNELNKQATAEIQRREAGERSRTNYEDSQHEKRRQVHVEKVTGQLLQDASKPDANIRELIDQAFAMGPHSTSGEIDEKDPQNRPFLLRQNELEGIIKQIEARADDDKSPNDERTEMRIREDLAQGNPRLTEADLQKFRKDRLLSRKGYAHFSDRYRTEVKADLRDDEKQRRDQVRNTSRWISSRVQLEGADEDFKNDMRRIRGDALRDFDTAVRAIPVGPDYQQKVDRLAMEMEERIDQAMGPKMKSAVDRLAQTTGGYRSLQEFEEARKNGSLKVPGMDMRDAAQRDLVRSRIQRIEKIVADKAYAAFEKATKAATQGGSGKGPAGIWGMGAGSMGLPGGGGGSKGKQGSQNRGRPNDED